MYKWRRCFESPTHSGFDRIFKAFNAFWHLTRRSLMCGMNVSFLSKMTPRKRAWSWTRILSPYSVKSGCSTRLPVRQKCTATVFELETVIVCPRFEFVQIEISNEDFSNGSISKSRQRITSCLCCFGGFSLWNLFKFRIGEEKGCSPGGLLPPVGVGLKGRIRHEPGRNGSSGSCQ